MQDISDLQKCPKLTLSCKNLANTLIFAGSLQNNSSLQKQRNISKIFKNFWQISFICKNLARYVLSPRIFRKFYLLQECFRESDICRNLAGCLSIARNLQDDSYLQEKRNISTICKNATIYLIFARTLPGTYYL